MSAENKNEKTDRAPRDRVYRSESGAVSLSTYLFTVPDGERKGEVMPMVEIIKIVREWSDAERAYVERRRFVSFPEETFREMLKAYVGKAKTEEEAPAAK